MQHVCGPSQGERLCPQRLDLSNDEQNTGNRSHGARRVCVLYVLRCGANIQKCNGEPLHLCGVALLRPAGPGRALDTHLRTVPWHQYLCTAKRGARWARNAAFHSNETWAAPGSLAFSEEGKGQHGAVAQRCWDLKLHYSVTELAKASCVGSEWRSKDPPNAARARVLRGGRPARPRRCETGDSHSARIRTVLCVWPSPFATMRSARPPGAPQ